MRFRFVSPFLALALLVLQQGAPSAQQQATPAQSKPEPAANTYASTYRPFPSRATVIRNATILTAAGPAIERGRDAAAERQGRRSRPERRRRRRTRSSSTPPASG